MSFTSIPEQESLDIVTALHRAIVDGNTQR